MTKKKAEKAVEKIEEELLDDKLPADEVDEDEDEDDDDLDDDDEIEEEAEAEEVLAPIPLKSGPRRVLVLEPEETRRNLIEAVVMELSPGSTVATVEDVDEAVEALDEDDFDMVVLDFQNPGYSNSAFVKRVNNQENLLLVAINLDNLEPGDEKNRLKLDPFRKLFE